MITLPSFNSTLVFIVIIFGVVVMFCWVHVNSAHKNTRHPLRNCLIFCIAWMAIGASLTLARNLPPDAATNFQTVSFLFLLIIVIAAAFSNYAKRLALATPQASLVAFHFFRLPLELVLHQWWKDGFLPIQMTYVGDNLDIITGIAAIIFAPFVWKFKVPAWTLWIFNIIGIFLLARIILIVNLTNPTPLKSIFGGYETGPQVLIGLYFPYVWLATVIVAAVLFFHLLLFRKLMASDKF